HLSRPGAHRRRRPPVRPGAERRQRQLRRAARGDDRLPAQGKPRPGADHRRTARRARRGERGADRCASRARPAARASGLEARMIAMSAAIGMACARSLSGGATTLAAIGRSRTAREIAALALLILLTAVTYLPTLRNGFLVYGFDDAIITDTPELRAFSWPNLR